MKLPYAVIAPFAGVGAFRASPPVPTRPAAPSTTRLRQFGTLGFDTANLYTREEEDVMRTQNDVMKYLVDTQEPAALRPTLGSSVVVSGFDPTDPSATEILDFLNSEDSPHFAFDKIVVQVGDTKAAKKRLIGRNARYTGLLDKLDFSEGDALPSVEQLAGASSWVAHVAGGDLGALADVAAAAEGAESVKNVVILVSGAQGVGGDALKEAGDLLQSKATSFAYTLVVVPEWNDDPEASYAYGLVNVTDVDGAPFAEGETFSREESLRIATECLAIENAAGKCVVASAAKEANCLEDMLIQGMREIGFNRLQEVEHMVMRGAKGYNETKAASEVGTPWQKAPEETEEQKAAVAKSKEERDALEIAQRDEAKKKRELKAMATQWAKREYLKKSLRKRIPIKEEEFVEIVWDRAMFEADLKWRTMQGRAVNESEERKKFREDQERKKAEAYQKEKERWKGMQYEELEPPEEKTVNFRT